MYLKYKSLTAIFLSILLVFSNTVYANQANSKIKEKVAYQNNKNEDEYLFNTIYKENFGRSLTTWNWIEEYKYYFDKNKSLSQMNKKSMSKSKNKYTVVFDFNDNITKPKSFSVSAGEYIKPISLYPKDNYYFLGWYKDKEPEDFFRPFDFNQTPINEDITLYAILIDIKNDTDGDGLVDGEERIFKTDIHKIDTDNDGLTDFEERYYTISDPTKPYSIIQGVLDSDVDLDLDGLTNKQEVKFGSNPIFEDKDKDYLNDSQEKKYKTKPDNKDTDNDGLLDGLEIKYGFNPLKSDTDGNGVSDKDEIITVNLNYDGFGTSKPKATIKLKAGNADNLTIERDDPKESIWMPQEVPGLIDAAYDFNVNGEIKEAILTFSFPKEYTKSDDFEPAIYYIDTENQEMVLLENQTIDWKNHTVTVKIKHFSKYAILNKKLQEKAWRNVIYPQIKP